MTTLNKLSFKIWLWWLAARILPRALWHLVTRAFCERLYYDPEDPMSTLMPDWDRRH